MLTEEKIEAVSVAALALFTSNLTDCRDLTNTNEGVA